MAELNISNKKYSAESFIKEWYQYGKDLFSSSKSSDAVRNASRVFQFITEVDDQNNAAHESYDECIRVCQEKAEKAAKAKRTAEENAAKKREQEQQANIRTLISKQKSAEQQILDEEKTNQKNKTAYVLRLVAYILQAISYVMVPITNTIVPSMVSLAYIFLYIVSWGTLYLLFRQGKIDFLVDMNVFLRFVCISLAGFFYMAFGLFISIFFIVQDTRFTISIFHNSKEKTLKLKAELIKIQEKIDSQSKLIRKDSL